MSGPARLLIVAGSDSGGGAGIQADIKTASALGVYAMTAVTAITVQNTLGVTDVHPIPPAIVQAQMEACLEDIGADAIKLGMLHSSELIATVARVLAKYPAIPVIADPVMVAKGGSALLEESAVSTLTELILPRALVITPNTEEASVILGEKVPHALGMVAAAARLAEVAGTNVVLKGGHLTGAGVTNYLHTADGALSSFVTPRIDTRNTHGTGCTLASAIASGIAAGLPLADAVAHACRFVYEAIASAPALGSGHWPIYHLAAGHRLL